MTTDGSSWNAIMQYSFLHVFANDGLIDRDELQMLQRLALQDGEVDERERDVLAKVFPRVNPQAVHPAGLEGIDAFADGTPLAGTDGVGVGALAVGKVEIKTEHELLAAMRDAEPRRYVGVGEAFETARRHAAA